VRRGLASAQIKLRRITVRQSLTAHQAAKPQEAIMTTTLKLWLSTIKTTVTNIGALIVFAILYAILLATFFRFIWIREATLWQVLFTYVFLILIPAEFFIYQASIIDHTRDGKFRWRAILTDALKFFLATIPVLLIAWLLYFLLNKLAGRFAAPIVPTLPMAPGPARPQPLHWPTLVFSTLRFILLGIMLPLAAIHLWFEVAACNLRESLRSGAKTIFSRLGKRFSGAFAFESVLIYVLGLIVFALIPYAILFVPFSPKGNKTDFLVFILRLLLTFIFSLIGWIVTIRALAGNAARAPEALTEIAPSVSPGTPAISESSSPL
jgi:hypothetical protein